MHVSIQVKVRKVEKDISLGKCRRVDDYDAHLLGHVHQKVKDEVEGCTVPFLPGAVRRETALCNGTMAARAFEVYK